MKRKVTIISLLLALVIATSLCGCERKAANISNQVVELKTNYLNNPIGLDSTPVFSWKLSSDENNQFQKTYEINLASSEGALKSKNYIWTSGEVLSDISTGIVYDGPSLERKKRYYWEVICKNQDEKVFKTIKPAFFETGITCEDFENARWITGLEKDNKWSEAQLYEEYTISFDIKPGNAKTGLLWGMDSSDYGSGYACLFEQDGDDVKMSITKVQNEQLINDETVYAFSNLKGQISVNINVTKTKVSYEIDGEQVYFEELAKTRPVYLIGTYVGRGAYTAEFDNILVKSKDNITIYEEDFEKEDNIFTPYFTKVADGKMIATSGITMMPGRDKPAPVFDKKFDLNKKQIENARLYISALGIYDVEINKQNISRNYFEPGTSAYEKRIYYRTYDVTELLEEQNDIQVTLGHGRYDRVQNTWGENLAFICLLEVDYKDGNKVTIVSDNSWDVCLDGQIRRDDFYWGEFIDNSKELLFLDKAKEMELPHDARLEAFEAEPVTVIKELSPVSVSEPVPGKYVYDFGENFSGYCKAFITGEKGQIVTLRYGETINAEYLVNKDGELGEVWTENLYTAHNTDYFMLNGNDEKELFNPKFVYRGFRYVEISGVEKAIPLDDIKGIVLGTDLKCSGTFECSDNMMNEIFKAINRTQQSNYTDLPTDCPQRDERLGWTGDFQVFAKTATYNSFTYNYYLYVLDALYDTQKENGSLASEFFTDTASFGAVGWGDAGVTVPWLMYQQYGRIEPLQRYYEGMCRYVDYQLTMSENYLNKGGAYGDHIALNGIDTIYTNTVQCAHSAQIVAQISRILDKPENVKKYEEIYEGYKKAWMENYLNEDGSIGSWSQTEYALPLAYGLYPEELTKSGVDKLNISVEAGGYHPNTGYIATQFLLPLLTENGYADSAYKLIKQGTFPSWGYMINLGMTTITEGWNVLYAADEGKIGINGSLNHYALGSVGSWYYEYVLGIQPDDNNPGFKRFYLTPNPGGELTYAKGSIDTLYGEILSSWEKTDKGYIYKFTVPANTQAVVSLPDSDITDLTIGSGEHEFCVNY